MCFLVSQVLSFRYTKQTSKNVVGTTFKISWLIESSWLMQESLGLNPDWSGESSETGR